MKISVISVVLASKQSKTGKSFQNAEFIFKNMDSGKVESKNITQYAPVFKQVSAATPGQVFEVVSEKNEATGYWDWTSFTHLEGQVAPKEPATANVTTSVKGGWETPQERAEKQVYIVKQSSLSTAASLLSIGATSPPSASAVIALAQQFVEYVFDVNKTDLFSENNDLPD